MKRPWSKDDYQREFADEIIRQIERGVAPWQKPWRPGERGSPENFHTGKSYTGGNNIYLAVRGVKKGYGDNRWGTYRQIQEAGGQVRKAERGAKILFFDRQYREAVKDQDGKPVKDGEGKQVYKSLDRARPFWRSFTVFNVEQAEGLQLERRDAQAAPEWERHRNAELVIRASDVPVNHVAGDRAYYSMDRDQVVLPEPGQFPTADGYYQTAMHELGHATGHPERMNRESLQQGLDKGFGSEEYAREELRAEISAMMTGERVGVGHDPQRGAAYVENWIAVLKKIPVRSTRRRARRSICPITWCPAGGSWARGKSASNPISANTLPRPGRRSATPPALSPSRRSNSTAMSARAGESLYVEVKERFVRPT